MSVEELKAEWAWAWWLFFEYGDESPDLPDDEDRLANPGAPS